VAGGRGGRIRQRGRPRGSLSARRAQRGALLLHQEPLAGRPPHVCVPVRHRRLRRRLQGTIHPLRNQLETQLAMQSLRVPVHPQQ